MDNSLRIPFPGINRKLIIIFYIILTNTSCINYYKVNSNKEVTAADHKTLLDTSKQLVVHLKGTSYALRNASINSNVLTGNLDTLSAPEVKYLHPSSSRSNRYKHIDANIVFNGVHVYAEGIEVPDNRQVSIPMDRVSKVDIYKRDRGATIVSHVIGTGLVLLPIVLIITIIAALPFSIGG